VEKRLSIGAIWSGLGSRLASNGFQCGLFALLAFLPIGGLALISPDQIQAHGAPEFFLAALFVSRFLTPPVATLIISYLARKERRIPANSSLGSIFKRCALPSVVLVLGVAVFTALSSLVLVVPGIAFALASCAVLPVMAIEGITGPQAVKRSWELTKDHRWQLLGFWLGFYLLADLFLFGIFLISTEPVGGLIEPLPLVQEAAFLPMVLGLAFLYAVMVIASYQIYTCLVEPPATKDD
jgi:hypothetical protein